MFHHIYDLLPPGLKAGSLAEEKKLSTTSTARGQHEFVEKNFKKTFFHLRAFMLRNTSRGGRIATRPMRLLLLRALDLVRLLHDLSEHHNAVAVEESNARETLAVLERVDHKRLLRGEVHLANDFKPFEILGTTAENHTFVSPAIRAWLVSVWEVFIH